MIRKALRRLVPKQPRGAAWGGETPGIKLSDWNDCWVDYRFACMQITCDRCTDVFYEVRHLDAYDARLMMEAHVLACTAGAGWTPCGEHPRAEMRDMDIHLATHLDDVLSGHRNRIVHQYRGKGHIRKVALRYIIQEATEAFLESYEQVWQRDYEGDDSKDLARFVASCIDDYLKGIN